MTNESIMNKPITIDIITNSNNNLKKKGYKKMYPHSTKHNQRPLSPTSPKSFNQYQNNTHHYDYTYYHKHKNNKNHKIEDEKILLTPPNSPEAVPYVPKINSTFEYNNRILAAKRNSNIRLVMSEFAAMKKNHVQLTQHTYNLVLEAHAILRKEGTPLITILKIYNEMLQAQIQPNTYTNILMIRTLCKRDVEVQKTVAMLKRQSARVGYENKDVKVLETECNIEKAIAIFHCAVADGSVQTFEIEVFNQILRVLSHYGNTADATFVYHQLEQPHVQAKPNSATFAALINLFGRAGNINMALYYYNVYCQAKPSLGPHDTSYIFNALVDCHLKCNLLDGALRVIERDMVKYGIKLTCIPYNSIIRHYCAHSQMDKAEALVDRLINGHQQDAAKYPSPDASSFGPILSAYCQANEWSKATRIYNELRKKDMSKAYGNLANYTLLCLANQEREKALDVIKDMTKANLEPDPILAERIITSFAEANQISQAIHALTTLQDAMSGRTLSKGCQHIFDSALEVVLHCSSILQVLQTMHSIDTLVKKNPKSIHSSENGLSSYVLICKTLVDSYFDQEQTYQHLLSPEDFLLLFDACFVVYDPQDSCFGDDIMKLLQDMIQFNKEVSDSLYYHVLSKLEQRGDTETAARWRLSFDACSSNSDTEDDIIIEIANQDHDVMFLPVSEIDTSKSQCFSSDILKAITDGNSQAAMCIFEDKIICGGLIPTPDIMKDAILLAGKNGDLKTALALYNNSIYAFKDIQDIKVKDDAIYMATNSLLIGFAQKGDMENAKVYCDRLKAMGRHPDSHGYASLLLGSAKCATDEATDALLIYEEAKHHHVKPTTFFYNVIISKLAKARKLEPALNLFEEMKIFKIPANSITYGAIISASVRSGSESQSRRLFSEMLSSNHQLRVGPFNNMMQFYVRQQPNRERVLEYFSELRRHHVKPSPHSYKLLMEAYTHIAPYDMPMAHRLLNDMMRCDNLRPQATHYATLIYSYGILQRDVQSAERVYAEMKKASIQADEAVYQAMVDTLISNDELEKAQEIYQSITHRNGSPYIENLFIRGYGEKGQIEAAEDIFEAMSDDKSQYRVCVVREPSTFEAMIRTYLENDKLDKAKMILDLMVKRDFPSKVIGVVADLIYK